MIVVEEDKTGGCFTLSLKGSNPNPKLTYFFD